MAAAKKTVRKGCSDDASTPPWDEDKKKSLRRSEKDDQDGDEDEDVSKADDDDDDKSDDDTDLVDLNTGGNGGSPVETVDESDGIGDDGDDDAMDDDDDDSDDDDDDDDDLDKSDDDDDEEDVDMTAPAKKSQAARKSQAQAAGVTAETLHKALRAVQRYCRANDGESRRSVLLSKAQKDTLKEGERRELYNLLAGEPVAKSTLAADIRRDFRKDETMAKSMQAASDDQDVGEYLEALSQNIERSLGRVAKSTEAASQRQTSVDLIMCKALTQIGGAVKAIGQRIQALESQPAHGPKSLSAQPLGKSFAGTPASEDALGADQIIGHLTSMNEQSHKDGRNGLSKGGRSITDGVSAMCSSGAIDRGLLAEVQSFAKSQRTAH